MTRKKLIKALLAVGGLSVVGVGGYEWFRYKHEPDLKYLDHSKEIIAELAEMIIPITDTPGAKDAKVEYFIIQAVKNNLDTPEQNIFIDGLKTVNNISKKDYEISFMNCTYAQKVKILSSVKENSAILDISIIHKVKNKFIGRSFYEILKHLTVLGFCTSEVGATQALAYDYIPVHYLSCVPIVPSQRSWATK